MRRHQQRQILELLDTIREAQTAGFYADAQDGLCAVGSFIEEIEGEGTKTVSLLTEHCELLFKANNGEIGEDVLHTHLIAIEKSIRSEFEPIRLELLFLSYSASMSDSILSIYQAAKADPNCNAVWLPVPYYDKNPDNSLGAMHYDGPECYEGIECADWQQYDIEARHPDVIVTFSPYDERNYITSVHPDFYCKRLHKLTDLLVYIPYFIITADLPEHFVTVPGCIYAHRIIVQSEKIRKTYIRVYKKNFGSTSGKPEDKFVALGSPKIDAVSNTRRADCNLPAHWRKLISGRKAVFYNTTIHSLLEENEQYLKKLHSVLDTFKARDDVVLWWRPHPLLEATCKSMRPQLFDAYEEIVRDYRRQGWGIYDDSTDLHRAIAWTDAYYGDGSSLVELFRASAKDVLIQNSICAFDSHTYNRARFLDFLEDGDSIWFSGFDTNGLYRYIKSEKRTQFMSFLQTKTVLERYRAVCRLGTKLYLAPVFSEAIAVYDIEQNTLHSVPINPKIKIRNSPKNHPAKCIAAYPFGKFIFFTPLAFGAIIRFDTETEQMDYLTDYVDQLRAIAFDKDAYWFSDSMADHGRIYLPSSCANAVVEFDMGSCKSTVHRLGKAQIAYQKICWDGENFWLMHRSGDAVSKWQKGAGIVSTIKLTHRSRYNHLIRVKGLVIRIPCKGDLTCDLIDPQKNNSVTEIKLKLPLEAASGLDVIWPDNDSVLCAKAIGDQLCIYATLRDAAYVFDVTGELTGSFTTEYVKPVCAKTHHKQQLARLAEPGSQYIYREEDFISLRLPDYLDYISQKEMEHGVNTRHKSSGQAILDYIRSSLR